MSFERAKKYLKKYKLENEIILFDDSTATVPDAAKCLNCRESQIAKTLGFEINNKYILIVCAGDKTVDNHKFKDEFKTKPKFIKYDQVEKIIGHVPGGVCPFGINEDISIYLDNSLKDNKFVYPACGTPSSAVKIDVSKFDTIVNCVKWINVTK